VIVFIRVQTRTVGGQPRHYASLVENKREGRRVVQRTVAYLGAVTEDQIPFLKAAYAQRKPRLVFDDEPGR
jgi:hypothetical protein